MNVFNFEIGQSTIRFGKLVTFDPSGQMAANMINFACILSITTGTIFIRFIDQNFNTTTSPFTLITTLFLNGHKTKQNKIAMKMINMKIHRK